MRKLSRRNAIFISYRRNDCAGHVGRLYDHLSKRFGKRQIFIDNKKIETGTSFPNVIEDAINKSKAVLVIMGMKWLSYFDKYEDQPKDKSEDFLVREISTALEQSKPIIPVLMEEAEMPFHYDLPKEITQFTDRQAIKLSDSRWDTDINTLINSLRKFGLFTKWDISKKVASTLFSIIFILTLLFWGINHLKAPPGEKVVVIPKILEYRKDMRLRSALVEYFPINEAARAILNHSFYCTEYVWNVKWANPSGQGFQNDFVEEQKGLVVFDRASGLTWARAGSDNYMSRAEANDYIQRLNSEEYGGFDNWRLPTLEEAMSLMARLSNDTDLYIDSIFAEKQRHIWTADTYADGVAWTVNFQTGTCGYDFTAINERYFVRPVR